MLLCARHTHTPRTRTLIDHIPVLLANRHKQWQWRARPQMPPLRCGCAPRSSFEKCHPCEVIALMKTRWWWWFWGCSQHKRSTRLESTRTQGHRGWWFILICSANWKLHFAHTSNATHYARECEKWFYCRCGGGVGKWEGRWTAGIK